MNEPECSDKRPTPARRAGSTAIAGGRAVIRGYGELTAQWRPLPEFLIIGAKRGGSTSFYYDLLRHSRICPLFPRPEHLPKAQETKGIHYFDTHYPRGERWYRSHLPSRVARARLTRSIGRPVITGEASPYYLFHPVAAQRAHDLVPDAKIIAVLRDPVMRTYSHWKERRRGGAETLDFAAALAAENERIGDDEERLASAPDLRSYAHENFSYARQSEYATALLRWYDRFPREQILILASEDYYRDPQAELDRAARFLGLEAQPIASGSVRNAAGGAELDPAIQEALAARFAPLNARLVELTGRTFPWASG